MSDPQFPLQCEDPQGCAQWAAERAAVMALRLPRAAQLHEAFLRRLNEHPPSSNWLLWEHAAERQLFRATSLAEIEDVLLCGHPIEASFFGAQGGRMVLRGDTGKGRPLLVVCQFPPPRGQTLWTWSIVTAYDPRSEPWRWSPDFERRICRCHPHITHVSRE